MLSHQVDNPKGVKLFLLVVTLLVMHLLQHIYNPTTYCTNMFVQYTIYEYLRLATSQAPKCILRQDSKILYTKFGSELYHWQIMRDLTCVSHT